MEAAVFSGTHVSALVTPCLKNIKMRKARGKEKVVKTVKWDDIKSKPLVNLKISQLILSHHNSRQYRLIRDLPFIYHWQGRGNCSGYDT